MSDITCSSELQRAMKAHQKQMTRSRLNMTKWQ